jgi:hypothetical protein
MTEPFPKSRALLADAIKAASPMMLPTIHLNGTSREALYGPYVAARQAVVEAIDKVRATNPNGRDYYPQGPDAIHEARVQHLIRIDCLEAIKAELEQLALATMPE